MTRADPSAISEWFRKAVAADKVEYEQNFDTEAFLFRAYRTDASAVELEIAGNAMEDYSTEEVLADLAAAGVDMRAAKDPSMRIQYHGDRSIPHFEMKYVRCDGRTYRVVRDSQHNVFIYDSSDGILKKMPSGPLVLERSIFQRLDQEWCKEIRSWRDEDQ